MTEQWLARGENRWEQSVLEKIQRDGPIMRKEVMELFGLSKFSAYQRLRRMVDKGLLIRVGYAGIICPAPWSRRSGRARSSATI